MNQELIDKLPASWNELKLKDYIKLLDVKLYDYTEDPIENMFVGLNHKIDVLSKLLDMSIEDIENLHQSTVNSMMVKIKFIDVEPNYSKVKLSIKFKTIEEIKYNDFITFLNLQHEPIKNIGALIKVFAKEDITEDYINNLSMVEVYAAFFILKTQLNRSLKTMFNQTTKNLVKSQFRKVLKHFRTILRVREKN